MWIIEVNFNILEEILNKTNYCCVAFKLNDKNANVEFSTCNCSSCSSTKKTCSCSNCNNCQYCCKVCTGCSICDSNDENIVGFCKKCQKITSKYIWLNLVYFGNYCNCNCNCSECEKPKYSKIRSFTSYITEENLKKFINIFGEEMIANMFKNIIFDEDFDDYDIQFLLILINNIKSDKVLQNVLNCIYNPHILDTIIAYYTIKSKKETVSDITSAIKNSTDEIKTFVTTTYSANNYYNY